MQQCHQAASLISSIESFARAGNEVKHVSKEHKCVVAQASLCSIAC